MSLFEFDPPFSPPSSIAADLRRQGFAVGSPGFVAELAHASLPALSELGPHWEHLPSDPHLRDVGNYRRRRHASFVVEGGQCREVAHRAHYQSPEYNALHGGLSRWFEPMREPLRSGPAFTHLLTGLGALLTGLTPTPRWYVEAHQFRIHTQQGVGRPTPEGAHRDGVDYVALLLVSRDGVRGGETRVFEARKPMGTRFTLRDPWTLLLLDDARVVHESTPILPADIEVPGHRDTLVLTYRRGGFQEPEGTGPQGRG